MSECSDNAGQICRTMINEYTLKTYNDKVILAVFLQSFCEFVVISKKSNYLARTQDRGRSLGDIAVMLDRQTGFARREAHSLPGEF